MKIGHGVNSEDIWEHWNQKQVTYKANNVAHEVFKEINRTEKHWDEINTQHDNTTEHQDREVMWYIRSCICWVVWITRVVLLINRRVAFCFWEQSFSCKECNDTGDCCNRQNTEQNCHCREIPLTILKWHCKRKNENHYQQKEVHTSKYHIQDTLVVYYLEIVVSLSNNRECVDEECINRGKHSTD